MSSASDLAKYFAAITAQVCGDYPVYLGTRCFEYLRANGKSIRFEIPHKSDETDAGRVFLGCQIITYTAHGPDYTQYDH